MCHSLIFVPAPNGFAHLRKLIVKIKFVGIWNAAWSSFWYYCAILMIPYLLHLGKKNWTSGKNALNVCISHTWLFFEWENSHFLLIYISMNSLFFHECHGGIFVPLQRKTIELECILYTKVVEIGMPKLTLQLDPLPSPGRCYSISCTYQPSWFSWVLAKMKKYISEKNADFDTCELWT